MTAVRNGATPAGEDGAFRHQAILYAGTDDFVARATPLVRSALGAEKPVLVALVPGVLSGLRESLDGEADRVRWLDITGIGLNPARIIPLWREFVAHHRKDGSTRGVFGIGQPIYAGRTPSELVEAERHEALLNLAFGDTSNFDLYCPYDLETLEAGAVEAAERTHPHIRPADTPQPSPGYRPEGLDGAHSGALPNGDGPSWQRSIDHASSVDLYRLVAGHLDRLRAGGTPAVRGGDLALAAAAVSAGIGGQHLRIWSEQRQAVVEIVGRVPIVDPLAGREWPPPAGEPEHGLWLANQLCDLVQWRSDGRQGSVVRLRQG